MSNKLINVDNLNRALTAVYTKSTALFATKTELNSGLAGKANSSHGTHVTYATSTPKANGTAAIGTSAKVAREDHVHPLQTTVSGNAGSANKVNNNLAIKLNGGTTEGTNLFTFNGSAAKTINITPSSIGAAASSHGTHLELGTTSSTAYRGDYGNIAYNHSQSAHAPSNAQKNSDITKSEIEAKLTGTITSHTHNYAAASHTSDTTSHITAAERTTWNAKSNLTLGTTSTTAAAGNHTHSNYALSSSVGTLSSLQTTSKDNLVAAINELFQSANNGKQLIADAIGEPLSASQTFSAMSNDIGKLLETFKTNMKNNGVVVGSSDKFESLISKIATMSENENGQKLVYKEGTGSSETLSVSLSFTPIIIIAECKYRQSNVDMSPDKTECYYNSFIHSNNYSRIGITMGDSFRDHSLTSFDSYNTVSGKTFKFKAYRDPNVPTSGTYAWTWLALGMDGASPGYIFDSSQSGLNLVTFYTYSVSSTISSGSWQNFGASYTMNINGKVKVSFYGSTGGAQIRVMKKSGSTTTYVGTTSISNSSAAIDDIHVDVEEGDVLQAQVYPNSGYSYYSKSLSISSNICKG